VKNQNSRCITPMLLNLYIGCPYILKPNFSKIAFALASLKNFIKSLDASTCLLALITAAG